MSGQGGSTNWGQNDARLRLGILADSETTFSLQSDQAMAMDAEGASEVSIDGRLSHPLAFTAEASSTPVSDLFATDGVFSSPTEDFWGTIWEGGPEATDPLIDNYQHSQTPVKYVRLDDITLEYTGNRLTRVTKEEGDDKTLEYSGNNLVRVTDTYNDIIKDLSYTGNRLTGVTVTKIV